MKITGEAQIPFFWFKISLRAECQLWGQRNFGCAKRCDFPRNPTGFPHNQGFLLHNIPENFHIISYFFLHPIRCPGTFTFQAHFNYLSS